MEMQQHLPRLQAPTTGSHHRGRLPVAALRRLCRSLNIKAAATFTFSHRSSTLIRVKILGELPRWNRITTSAELRAFAEAETVSLVPFSHKRKHRLGTIEFGYLALSRAASLNETELQAFDNVCAFTAAYIYDRSESDVVASLERASKKIQDKGGTSAPPGTRIRDTLACVHQGTRAHISVYCAIDVHVSVTEYKLEASAARCSMPRSETASLPPTFCSTLVKRKVLVWLEKPPDPISSALSTILEWTPEHPIYLCAAHEEVGQLIGLWIVGFEKHNFVGDIQMREFMSNVLAAASESARYIYQRRFMKLVVNPIFNSRDSRVDESLLFALMPFKEPWSDRIWEKMIRPIAKSCNLAAKRADDLYGRDIMEDIWKSILQAKVVVADITSRNANVFYELGIAHTLGKPVILLTQSVADIPFDLNRYRHIVYADNLDGYEILNRQLAGSIGEICSTPAQRTDGS